MPFFFEPSFATRVECLPCCVAPDRPPRYAPTTAGEHLLAKYAVTHAGYDATRKGRAAAAGSRSPRAMVALGRPNGRDRARLSAGSCAAGACQISCGRCPCCPTLAAAAEAAGLTEFAWAMNATADRLPPLSSPGLALTLMAPDNNAMASLINKLGGRAAVAGSAALTGKLAAIMSYHAVPPLEGYEAWSSPFLVPGTRLPTEHRAAPGGPASTLTVGGGGGGIKLAGAGSSADVTRRDIYACKGYLNVLNWYLLPPGEALE
ncbi:hypothetical protein HT031_006757 [Scenedesmus sp. PABB004]|nr:hypothetical protein HT031_006757 [Scenedesmus sp. PABB004]